MIIRIRLGKGAKVGKGRRKNKRLASVVAALLNPAAVMAAALAVWRVTADMKLTGSFAITSGFFSHWQVWLGAAIVLQVCSWLLNRYARSEDSATS
jgi:hypothetical protein